MTGTYAQSIDHSDANCIVLLPARQMDTFSFGATLAALWFSQCCSAFIDLGPMLQLDVDAQGNLHPNEARTDQLVDHMLQQDTFQLCFPSSCPPMPPGMASLVRLLTLSDPVLRFSAEEALAHPWFHSDDEPSEAEMEEYWREVTAKLTQDLKPRCNLYWGVVEQRAALIQAARAEAQQRYREAKEQWQKERQEKRRQKKLQQKEQLKQQQEVEEGQQLQQQPQQDQQSQQPQQQQQQQQQSEWQHQGNGQQEVPPKQPASITGTSAGMPLATCCPTSSMRHPPAL
jgi:serine/threonine protein kinase